MLVTVFFLAVVSFLTAQELTVDYLEGYLDLQEGGDWVELHMGDAIPRDATIRLDQDSLTELSGMNMSFTLTQPGVYLIEDLMASRQTMNSAGLGNLLSGKVATMFSERVSGPDTVGGVRAAEVETGPSIDWMTSEAADMISQAKEMIGEGKYSDAMGKLEEAYDFAAEEYEEQEISFYKGYIHTVNGKVGKALAEFSRIEPDPDQPYYDDLFLLKGKLLVDSFAFDEADEWFEHYEPGYSTGKNVSIRQSIYLFHGGQPKKPETAEKRRRF